MPGDVAILSAKKTKSATIPAHGRSARIESRLKEFGYVIQLNLFSDEK